MKGWQPAEVKIMESWKVETPSNPSGWFFTLKRQWSQDWHPIIFWFLAPIFLLSRFLMINKVTGQNPFKCPFDERSFRLNKTWTIIVSFSVKVITTLVQGGLRKFNLVVQYNYTQLSRLILLKKELKIMFFLFSFTVMPKQLKRHSNQPRGLSCLFTLNTRGKHLQQ